MITFMVFAIVPDEKKATSQLVTNSAKRAFELAENLQGSGYTGIFLEVWEKEEFVTTLEL